MFAWNTRVQTRLHPLVDERTPKIFGRKERENKSDTSKLAFAPCPEDDMSVLADPT
jgi:hypothetical protein